MNVLQQDVLNDYRKMLYTITELNGDGGEWVEEGVWWDTGQGHQHISFKKKKKNFY